MPKPFCFAFASIAAVCRLAAPGFAQEATLPPPPLPPGDRGEPLPPIHLRYNRQIKAVLPLDGSDTGFGSPSALAFTGDVHVVWGDITFRADKIVYDGVLQIVKGEGNIVFVRGDETIRGAAITFFLDTGNFAVQNGVVVSPPYSVRGQWVEQVNGVLRATRGAVTPDVNGNGELRLQAREIRVVNGASTDLSDVRVYVYGQRVLTLPRYRIMRRYGPRKSDIPAIPLQFKVSRISGFALGLGNTWTLARNATVDAQVFFPTKNGPQYAVTATYDLLGSATDAPSFLRRRGRDSLFAIVAKPKKSANPEEPSADPKTLANPEEPSRLRRLLTVKASPGKDPVLDFDALLATPESVGRPLDESERFASVSAVFSGKEEVGVKRQGNLLLARRPEVQFSAVLPLRRTVPNNGEPFDTNAAARDFLRTPRFALLADLSAGAYHEDRLSNATGTQGGITGVDANRFGGIVGVNLLPLLVGKNILIRGEASYQQFNYSTGNDDTYRVPQLGVAASYIVNRNTQIGGALYRREPSGATPFFFDQIDTRSEAQGLVQGRLTSRVTAAFLVRYDMEQARLFDYGVTVGYRGISLEPRFGYRKLGGLFSVGFNLVGL